VGNALAACTGRLLYGSIGVKRGSVMINLDKSYVKEFEKLIESAMNAYGAQGIAVSIFGKDDTYYENFFGYRDTDNKLEINEDTIFGMASISKSFTCLALLQLVEKGVVNLDGLVSDYIPEFRGKNQKGLKLKHLMSHSGGFFPEKRVLARDVAKEIGIWDKFDNDIAYNEALAEEGIKIIASRLDNRAKLIGRPGELMSYSNDSYGLISDIVRRFGGCKTFSEYINENILKPLDMTRSSLEFENPAKDENSTQLYINRDGKLEWSKDFYDNAFVLMGGGAIKSTINDLKKYTRIYFNEGREKNGKEILGSYYIKEMQKPRQLYRFQQYYGYGLSTKFMDDITVIGHGGSLTGVANMFQWSPELECGVIVFCNTSEFPAASMADAAMKLAMGKDPGVYESPFVDMTLDDTAIKSATGKYISGEGQTYEILYENDKLTLKFSGAELNLRPVRKDIFIVQKPYATMDLILLKDKDGKVWGIRAGGRIIPKEV